MGSVWEALHVIFPNGAVNLSDCKRIDPRGRSEKGVPSPVLDSMVCEGPSLPAWRPLEAGLATRT